MNNTNYLILSDEEKNLIITGLEQLDKKDTPTNYRLLGVLKKIKNCLYIEIATYDQI